MCDDDYKSVYYGYEDDENEYEDEYEDDGEEDLDCKNMCTIMIEYDNEDFDYENDYTRLIIKSSGNIIHSHDDNNESDYYEDEDYDDTVIIESDSNIINDHYNCNNDPNYY